MREIFLSASVPNKGRGDYYKTAEPFLIQCAVRELAIATLGTYKLVWGGHPSITPMLWAICDDLGLDYSKSTLLYQSGFFAGSFPKENTRFDNVIVVDPVNGDLHDSLKAMREEMLSRTNLKTAVFIGGMEGIEEEYQIFKKFHPDGTAIVIGATGGAAKELALKVYGHDDSEAFGIDFHSIFEKLKA